MGALNEYSSLFKVHLLLLRWGLEANKATDEIGIIGSVPPSTEGDDSQEGVGGTPSLISPTSHSSRVTHE
jgi:hypothetical protein